MYRYAFGSALLIAAFAAVGFAQASHSWGPYHWERSENPLQLMIGDNVSGSWKPFLAAAVSDWNISDVLGLSVVPGMTSAPKGKNTPKNCVPTPGRAEVCSAKYGQNGWLGIASIWAYGDHITQATVKMNDTYFGMRTYNTPDWKQSVMCQEIGHVFGLDHQDEDFYNTPLGTCMDYSLNIAPNTHPNTHDYDQLESMYAHLDGLVSAPVLSPSQQHAVDHNDVKTWGREIRASDDKRHSVFERDFGNGTKVFTFVTWAH